MQVLLLSALLVAAASAERMYGSQRSREQTTTEDYYSGYGNYGGRSPTFDRDEETSILRPSGSSGSGSGSGRFTYEPAASTRSSYLERFTTESPYDRAREYDSERGSSGSSSYDRYGTRRPSYVTDRWGDVVGGERSTRYGYVTMYTTPSYRDRYTTGYSGVAGSLYTRYTSAWDRDRVTSRYGSGSDRDSFGSGSSSFSGRDRFDRNEAYLRIQFELVKLTNDKGMTLDGKKCDTFGDCDTVCYGYIDVERPNAPFPGSRDLKYFNKLYETEDNNSPSFSRANVTRDVCGSPFREAVARVYCEDDDSLSKADLINKWDCPIAQEPDYSETVATWQTGECRPQAQADKMRLTYRYKLYQVPRSRCDPNVGAPPAGATTTTRRRT